MAGLAPRGKVPGPPPDLPITPALGAKLGCSMTPLRSIPASWASRSITSHIILHPFQQQHLQCECKKARQTERHLSPALLGVAGPSRQPRRGQDGWRNPFAGSWTGSSSPHANPCAQQAGPHPKLGVKPGMISFRISLLDAELLGSILAGQRKELQ